MNDHAPYWVYVGVVLGVIVMAWAYEGMRRAEKPTNPQPDPIDVAQEFHAELDDPYIAWLERRYEWETA